MVTEEANLSEANLIEAKLSEADLRGVKVVLGPCTAPSPAARGSKSCREARGRMGAD
jgi:uncharacterized protein YjbI with pentapeptide repeats